MVVTARRLFILMALFALETGCTSGGGGTTCGIAGGTQACLCAGGASGAQVCDASGVWSACVCSSSGDDVIAADVSGGDTSVAADTLVTDTNVATDTLVVVDCVAGDWTEWSACSVDCGGGTQTRTRSVEVEPEGGGAACPALTDSQACNTQGCAVDCVLGPWGNWGPCSAECNGSQLRIRNVTTQPSNGGAACGQTTESRDCGGCAQLWQTCSLQACTNKIGPQAYWGTFAASGVVQGLTLSCSGTATVFADPDGKVGVAGECSVSTALGPFTISADSSLGQSQSVSMYGTSNFNGTVKTVFTFGGASTTKTIDVDGAFSGTSQASAHFLGVPMTFTVGSWTGTLNSGTFTVSR